MTYFGPSERGFKQLFNNFLTEIVNKPINRLIMLLYENNYQERQPPQEGKGGKTTISGLSVD
jgi:hypothetical protein